MSLENIFNEFQRRLSYLTICPITLQRFVDPVILTPSGQIYERSAIENWLANNNTDPLTRDILPENYNTYPIRLFNDVINHLNSTLFNEIINHIVENFDLARRFVELENQNRDKDMRIAELDKKSKEDNQKYEDLCATNKN